MELTNTQDRELKPHIEIFDNFGVDAGNISVADLDYIQSEGGIYGSTAKKSCHLVTIDPGTYKVKVSIPETYNGIINIEKIIHTKGNIITGDICYLFSFSDVEHYIWHKFLDKTDYLKNENCNFFSANTGGDGCFSAHITLTKLQTEE